MTCSKFEKWKLTAIVYGGNFRDSEVMTAAVTTVPPATEGYNEGPVSKNIVGLQCHPVVNYNFILFYESFASPCIIMI